MVDTTNRSTNDSAYTQAGSLSITITPASTASKVRLTAMLNAGASSDLIGRFAIFRGSTDLTPGGKDSMAVYRAATGTPSDSPGSLSFGFTDAPNTTSAVTYTVRWRATGDTLYLGRRGGAGIDTVSGVFRAEELSS